MVSVVTVNFNGAKYLRGLLSSLQRQTYRKTEVLLVDNASTDGSVALVERHFPDVRILRSRSNLGFAGGNNLGIRKATGSYIALINNDTLPDPDWLLRLVEAADASECIAGVGSKILFAYPFVPVTLEVVSASRQNPRPTKEPGLGLLVGESSAFENSSYSKRVFASGFSMPERRRAEMGRWAETRATVYLPVDSLADPGDLILRIFRPHEGEQQSVRVLVGEVPVGDSEVAPGWQELRFVVQADLALAEGFDVINNAASFLEPDGTAGDRGIFQPDRGQYDSAEEVKALCGCAMLLSRAALEHTGTFDEDYFMYFEDTELSWRLRKAGFRLLYEPRSVVRHHHASTSGEWSPLFNFLVARNRILMLVKHAALRRAARAYLEELARLVRLVALHRSFLHVDVRTRLKIHWSLLTKAPRALLKRLGLLAH